MDINEDFNKRVSMHSSEMPWVPSPMKGVDRRMLDRLGDEVARATSIVRYAAGSSFAAHTHTGGEEFFVLEGVFQDEHGDFPAGTYVRNPPTSFHTPRSDEGCTIFVKLWQYQMNDRTHVIIDTNKMDSVEAAKQPGVSIMPLYKDDHETVHLETWEANTTVSRTPEGGAEFLVLEGSFEESSEQFKKGSWLRIPSGRTINIQAGASSAKVWVKAGHLPYAKRPAS